MRHVYLPALLAVMLMLCGCMERTTRTGSELSATAGWEAAGSFGGHAEISKDSSDPLEVRFTEGQFKSIAGIDVTDDEVWVCDTDISRIQIFDLSGRLLRTIGSGIYAAGVLPTEMENYEETLGFNRREDTRWEDTHGEPWRGTYSTNFRAADVVVVPGGYWMADLTHTCGLRDPIRKPVVCFITDGGDTTIAENWGLLWPSHLAYGDGELAAADDRANGLIMVTTTSDPPKSTTINTAGDFRFLMGLEKDFGDSPQYLQQHRRFTNASQGVGGTYLPAGVAFGFGKLLVCDTLNRRIQVFEARSDNPNRARNLRLVNQTDENGAPRFSVPCDIAVGPEGDILVLDRHEAEVVVLDPSFKRIGSFGYGEFVDPYALAISPDGTHCFITDRRSNKVFHYERRD